MTRVTPLQTPLPSAVHPKVRSILGTKISSRLQRASEASALVLLSMPRLPVTPPAKLNDVAHPRRQGQSSQLQVNTYYSQGQLPSPTTTHSVDYTLIHIYPWHSSNDFPQEPTLPAGFGPAYLSSSHRQPNQHLRPRHNPGILIKLSATANACSPRANDRRYPGNHSWSSLRSADANWTV